VSTAFLTERPHSASPFQSVGTDSEVVEVPLLLPRWQIAALEEIARRHGLTTGQLIRRVIADLVHDAEPELD
jgi:hypothetical protein